MRRVPRYHVETETSYVIVQASQRIHTCDSLSLARKICRNWNRQLRKDEKALKERTAPKRQRSPAGRNRQSAAQ